jgi:hypothetical protein
MDTDNEIIQSLVRVELANRMSYQIAELKKTHGNDEYERLSVQHTGNIQIEDDGVDVEFYWTGGKTVMISDEFMKSGGRLVECLEGSMAIRVGSFILDFVEDQPKFGLTVYRRRELKLPG